MRKLTFIIAVISFIFAPFSAKAQDILAPELPPPDTQAIFESLSPELQDEIMDESLSVRAVCEADPMYQRLYDCQCIALKFVDARLLEGPAGDPVQIAQRFAPKCKDAGKAAGYGLRVCPNLIPPMIGGEKEYCECFANEFAKSFVAIPRTTSGATRAALFRGMNTCNERLNVR